MTAWLKHQSSPYPVKLSEKMLTFFTHAVSKQYRCTFFYKAHGITAGMGIDAMEKVFH
jgi:hypothetical protein